MSLAATNWPAATVVPLRVSVPVVGRVVTFTAWQVVAVGVAEAEVGRLQDVGDVFQRRDRLVGAAGGRGSCTGRSR